MRVIDDILYEYIYNRNKPFTKDQVKKAYLEEHDDMSGPDEKYMDEILKLNEEIVCFEDTYYPKVSFMEKFSIRINVTDFELTRNILIPGHRLVPFYRSNSMIDRANLFFNSKSIQKREMSFDMKDIFIYFSLLDMERMPISNPEALFNNKQKIKINVYDLENFYASNNFSLDDSLIIKAKDLNTGEFYIEYESKKDMKENIFRIKQNDNLFLEHLREELKIKNGFRNVEKQLLNTYFRVHNSGKEIKNTLPGTAFGPLLNNSEEIQYSILQNGAKILHFKNQNVEDLEIYPDFSEYDVDRDEDDYDLSTIDGILMYLGNSNCEPVIRALIIHLIVNDRYSLENVYDYVFKGMDDFYMPGDIEDKFIACITGMHDEIEQKLKKRMPKLNENILREKILNISLEVSLFLRELDNNDIDVNTLPKNDMYRLLEVQKMFDNILFLLEDPKEGESAQITDLVKNIKTIHKNVRMDIEGIKDKVF